MLKTLSVPLRLEWSRQRPGDGKFRARRVGATNSGTTDKIKLCFPDQKHEVFSFAWAMERADGRNGTLRGQSVQLERPRLGDGVKC